MQIKICGITNLDDALLCANNGADALGFIFYKKSKRYINPENAGDIINNLPPFILKVGVFVDEDFETVNSIAKIAGLNAVQLHGSEPPEYIEKIQLPVIKGFRIAEGFDWEIIDQFKTCRILLDSFSASEMGGTGKSFEWKNIPPELRNRMILSGGISIRNIEHVFDEIKPAAVDLSSSLESALGIKDQNKVKEFFKTINHLRSS